MQALLGSYTWPLLKAEFEKDVALNHLSLHSTFDNIVHDPSKPVTKLTNTIQSISHQLASIKHPLHDTEITNMILLCLHESFSSVCSTLITHKEESTPTEIITTVKEHEVHMIITNHLPTATSAAMTSPEKTSTLLESSGNKGGYEGQPQKWRWTGGTQKGWMVLTSIVDIRAMVVVKCIADIPQQVKDCIVSGTAHVASVGYMHAPKSIQMNYCIFFFDFMFLIHSFYCSDSLP